MALISQKFKNDTKTNSIDVEPVIVLADSTDDSYTVLDIYSNSTLNLKDQDGDTMASFTSNGASVLYHNNTATVSTVSGGTSLTVR